MLDCPTEIVTLSLLANLDRPLAETGICLMTFRLSRRGTNILFRLQGARPVTNLASRCWPLRLTATGTTKIAEKSVRAWVMRCGTMAREERCLCLQSWEDRTAEVVPILVLRSSSILPRAAIAGGESKPLRVRSPSVALRCFVCHPARHW